MKILADIANFLAVLLTLHAAAKSLAMAAKQTLLKLRHLLNLLVARDTVSDGC